MIRSTFAGFTTAQLAMAASQRALDVTGQNIANINTEGYTRQRLDIASLNTQGGHFYNSNPNIVVGYGVEMLSVSQLRDPFLDAQYRSQICKLGTTDAQAAGLEQLEPIFDETTMAGIKQALISISNSLDTLGEHVGEKEYDSMVRSNMQNLLNLFHENATRLKEVRDDMQMGFQTTDVADLNKVLQNIANLNTTIKNSQVLGNPALELLDERNKLLDELGSYLPISVDYWDQPIGPKETVEILDVYFVDTTGRKIPLISDGTYGSFDADITGDPVELFLTDCKGNSGINVTDRLGSGSLKGTLDCLNKSGTFDDSDFNGIGYYEKAFDTFVATFAEEFNKMNETVDANGVRQPGTNPLFEKINANEPMSASNIRLASGWVNGTYYITPSVNVGADGTIPSGANENILNMINLLKKDVSFTHAGSNTTFFTGSFYSCFNNIEDTLGVDKKAAETTLANQIAVLNKTANSRDSISGVQLDEEGMNLLHYNQSYAAAARLMTTLDEALDKLINGTGVVGR